MKKEKMKDKKHSLIFLVCLILLIGFHLANNIFFLTSHPLPEGKDSYAHLTAYNNFSQILKSGEESPFYEKDKSFLYNLIYGVIDYPPLFYLSAFFVNFLFSWSLFNGAMLTSGFYLALLLIAVYSLGKKISPSSGLLAAFICSMFPIVFLSSRHFSLELPLAAITALSVLLLLKTEFFSSRKYSVFLGIIMGLGMLLKQTYFLYFSGPLGVYCFFCFKNHGLKTDKLKKINFLIAGLLFLSLSALFYLNKEVYVSVANRAGFYGAVNDKNLLSVRHLTYYFGSLKNTLGLFFTGFLVFSILFIGKMKPLLRNIILSWILVPFVALNFFVLKYGEYTIAFLPAFALICASAVNNLTNKNLKKTVIFTLIIYGLINYYNVSLGQKNIFYSTYYPREPEVEVVWPENKGKDSFKEIIRQLQASGDKVGVIYDGLGLNFPQYFGRCLFAEKQNNVYLVDFMFRPGVFSRSAKDFDKLIFVTDSQRSWPTIESLENFSDNYNKSFFADVNISRQAIEKIVSMGNDYKRSAVISFAADKKENIYIYSRKF
jgi:hypothetical protein